MEQQFKMLEHHLDQDKALREFVDRMLVDLGMVGEGSDGRLQWH